MPTPATIAAPATGRIADLVTSTLHVHTDEPVSGVAKLWDVHPDDDGMAVLGGDRVRYLSRARFFLQLGRKFGYALFENRPVGLLAEEGSAVEADVDPVEVISLASQREPDRVFDDILVLRDSAFQGLVSMRSLIVHHRSLLVSGMAERALLEERNRRLSELNRLQAGLVSGLTSGLRNPISTLLGLARSLAADPVTGLRHGTTLDALTARAASALAFVDDLSDLARLEAGELEPRPERIDLVQLLAGTLEELRAHAGAGVPAVSVSVHGASEVRTDPVIVRRIVCGLLGAVAAGDVSLLASTLDGTLTLDLVLGGATRRQAEFDRLLTAGDEGAPRRDGPALRLAVVRGLTSRLGGTLGAEAGRLWVRLPLAGP